LETNQDICNVCHGPLGENRAACTMCTAEFHLALRTDIPAIDCGDAWIDDELQALVFGCNACRGRVPEPARRRRAIRRNSAGANIVARRRRRSAGNPQGDVGR